MKKILFIIGTRPEAIKLAPLILTFQKDAHFSVRVAITGQHRTLVDSVLAFFKISPDYDLNLMLPNQNLLQFIAKALVLLDNIFTEYEPELIFVQGDTTTALASSLVAFHKKIRIAHIEAGLRSHNKHAPFPEEINRVLTSHLSDFHFAPTQEAVANLHKENIHKNVYCVGNTVIDALFMVIAELKTNTRHYLDFFTGKGIDFSKKIILVTCHRREVFGQPLQQICKALLRLVDECEGIQIVYPVHPNPNIKNQLQDLRRRNIILISPLEYAHFIWLMHKSFLILTDSGGVQEEAPSLGKPVLVLREVTERKEGITAGNTKLVGIDTDTIVSEAMALITASDNAEYYQRMTTPSRLYGDGTATQKILSIIKGI